MKPRPIADMVDAIALLVELGASPWLVRHHELVAEAAREVVAGLESMQFGGFKAREVVVGAALHDVGKVVHTNEMSVPGSRHEAEGKRLLVESAVDARLARHCVLHASWAETDDLTALLVAVADKLWKGKRVVALEEKVVRGLAEANGRTFWDVFSLVEPVFESVASRGDVRLSRSVV